MLEIIVESHSGGGVETLAEDCGGDAVEKSSNAFLFDDTDANCDRTDTRWRWRDVAGGE